uniref:TPR_REGION domain-containing protein n=1 Tax=Syphacia muris TaxID=451379 RepID=A0A0N5ALW1_9BILA
MTAITCFTDDCLELAARLLCSIYREVGEGVVLGSLCSSDSYLYNTERALELSECRTKLELDNESSDSNKAHAEANVRRNSDVVSPLIHLFPSTSVIALWRTALCEDKFLVSKELDNDLDIDRDLTFDRILEYAASCKTSKMNADLYKQTTSEYSDDALPLDANKLKCPFSLLILNHNIGHCDSDLDTCYQRFLSDVSAHDLCLFGRVHIRSVVSIFDMEFIFDEIITLYNLELYEDAIMLLEVCASDILGLSKSQFAILTAAAADSYFQCGHYTKSQLEYYRALRIIKSLPEPLSNPKFCEAELKYRLYCCLMKQNKKEEAMGVLGSIPEHDMTPKVKAALARLHSLLDVREQKNGSETTSNALLLHKKVLEACPFAFLSLSFIIRNGVKIGNYGRWPATALAWLEAQEAISVHNYRKAVEILNKVADNNLRIIVEIGRLYYVYGERQKATNYLQRAHNIDPCYTSSMSILAYIYAQDHKLKELESLGANLMLAAESPEAWIAYGFLAKCQGKHDSALFFAQKAIIIVYVACMLSESQADPMAMLLKALVFMDKRKYDEAVKHLRDALIYDPQNYDLYETLVQAYSEQHRPNEARLTANHCRHHLGQNNARALYLCAKVAAKDERLVNEAQIQLEKAVSLSPHLLDAVHLLVELYDRKKNYDKAISLLKKQTEITVDSRLHQLLGDILAKSSQLDAACDQYKYVFYRIHFFVLLDSLVGIFDPKSITSAMNSLESTAGMSTPEPVLSNALPCPAAPRRRGASRADALSSNGQRNS